MSLSGFLTSLITIGFFGQDIFYYAFLLLDGLIYMLVTYSYRIFSLMCSLNLSVLEGIVSGLVTKAEALVMVFVVFKVGVALISYMLEPEKAMKDGTKLVTNILITAALLISKDFVFGVFNELSMLIMGNPTGYPYTTLSTIANVTNTKDEGLIMRAIFGKENNDDVGDFIAYSTLSIFIHDYNSVDTSTKLYSTINTKNGYDFGKIVNLNTEVGKSIEYKFGISTLVGIYVVYCLVKTAIEMGIRLFKLMILQLLAPLAIITCVDGGFKSKTFTTFWKKYISVWVEAFVRMLTMLVIIVFVSKFFINIGEFFTTVSAEKGFMKGLIQILVVLAAFKFATDAPKFIDEVLGTSIAGKDTKNFVGGLLGFGAGAIAGAIGGAAGGGIGGAIAGLATGGFKGAAAGSKGNNIAELIKGQKEVGKGAMSQGKSIASRGGLGNVMLGSIPIVSGVTRSSQDQALAKLDRQSAALDALEAAETFAVKDSKMGSRDSEGRLNGYDEAWQAEHGSLDDFYSAGYGDIKLGDSKDAYASKMLEFDKNYQDAQARYENLSQTDLSSYSNNVAATSRRLAEAQSLMEAATTDADRAAAQTLIDEAQANFDEAQRDYDAASRPILEAKEAAQRARAEAEQRAKDYYDGRKNYESDHSSDVQRKRESYTSVGGADYSAAHRTPEKRRIHDEKAAITNSDSYKRTHGQNPKE